MQYDVSAAQITSTNTIVAGPVRIKGVMISYASGGTVVLKDGGSTGTTKFSFTAPAAAGSIALNMAGEGIRCQTSLHGTLSNATITVIYG